jgi:hypothetical protein
MNERDGVRGGTRLAKIKEITKEEFGKYGGKHWVKVLFNNGTTWVPSFRDLFGIIALVADCEEEKYPPPQRGRFYARDFFKECCEARKPGQSLRERWLELWEKYKLLDRSK